MPDLYVDLRSCGYTHADLRKRSSRPGWKGYVFPHGLLTACSFALTSECQRPVPSAIEPLNCGYAGSRVPLPVNCHRPRWPLVS